MPRPNLGPWHPLVSPSERSTWTDAPFHDTEFDRAGRYDAARAADTGKKAPASVVCEACRKAEARIAELESALAEAETEIDDLHGHGSP